MQADGKSRFLIYFLVFIILPLVVITLLILFIISVVFNSNVSINLTLEERSPSNSAKSAIHISDRIIICVMLTGIVITTIMNVWTKARIMWNWIHANKTIIKTEKEKGHEQNANKKSKKTNKVFTETHHKGSPQQESDDNTNSMNDSNDHDNDNADMNDVYGESYTQARSRYLSTYVRRSLTILLHPNKVAKELLKDNLKNKEKQKQQRELERKNARKGNNKEEKAGKDEANDEDGDNERDDAESESDADPSPPPSLRSQITHRFHALMFPSHFPHTASLLSFFPTTFHVAFIFTILSLLTLVVYITANVESVRNEIDSTRELLQIVATATSQSKTMMLQVKNVLQPALLTAQQAAGTGVMMTTITPSQIQNALITTISTQMTEMIQAYAQNHTQTKVEIPDAMRTMLEILENGQSGSSNTTWNTTDILRSTSAGASLPFVPLSTAHSHPRASSFYDAAGVFAAAAAASDSSASVSSSLLSSSLSTASMRRHLLELELLPPTTTVTTLTPATTQTIPTPTLTSTPSPASTAPAPSTATPSSAPTPSTTQPPSAAPTPPPATFASISPSPSALSPTNSTSSAALPSGSPTFLPSPSSSTPSPISPLFSLLLASLSSLPSSSSPSSRFTAQLSPLLSTIQFLRTTYPNDPTALKHADSLAQVFLLTFTSLMQDTILSDSISELLVTFVPILKQANAASDKLRSVNSTLSTTAQNIDTTAAKLDEAVSLVQFWLTLLDELRPIFAPCAYISIILSLIIALYSLMQPVCTFADNIAKMRRGQFRDEVFERQVVITRAEESKKKRKKQEKEKEKDKVKETESNRNINDDTDNNNRSKDTHDESDAATQPSASTNNMKPSTTKAAYITGLNKYDRVSSYDLEHTLTEPFSYPFRPFLLSDITPVQAPFYPAEQLSAVIYGFVLSFVIFFLCVYVVAWSRTYEFLWWYPVRTYWISFLICWCLKKILLFVLAPKYLLGDKKQGQQNVVLHPRLFALYTLFMHVFGVFMSATSSLTRLCYYVLIVIGGVYRVDVTMFPHFILGYDSSYVSFMSLCYAYHCHTCPVMREAVSCFWMGIEKGGDGKRLNGDMNEQKDVGLLEGENKERKRAKLARNRYQHEQM